MSEKVSTGRLGCSSPTFSSVFDALTLSAAPARLYSSAGSPSVWRGIRPVPLPPARSGLPSSLMPSRPMASTPKPTGPGV
ncbi:hypothetical protein D3C78_482050 [compost metagenome]